MPYEANAYRPSNSMSVPGYVGNTLKEYSDLLNNKQEKFDTGVELAGRFGEALQNVVALEKDKGALTELYNKHSAELADYAKQGNYEDLVPRITRSARQFTSDYQPFAARYQQRSAYLTELQKKLTAEKPEDRISQDQYNAAIKGSDKQDRGLTIDPLTGKYTGSYNGMGVVSKPDEMKMVDDMLKDRAIHKTGYDKVTGQGQYVMVTEHGNVSMSEADIAGIIKSGMQLHAGYKSYMDNLTQLKAAAFDDPKEYDAKQVISQNYKLDDKGERIPILNSKGKKTGRFEVKDTTVQDLINSGKSVKDILFNKEMSDIQNKDYNTALTYAIHKYYQNDSIDKISNLQEGIDSKNAREKAKDMEPAFSFNLLQPTGTGISDLHSMQNAIETRKVAARTALNTLTDWTAVNGVKMLGSDGKPTTNVDDKGVTFVDKNGKVVTSEGLTLIMAHRQAKQATSDIAERDQMLRDKSGFHPPADLEKEARLQMAAVDKINVTSAMLNAAGKFLPGFYYVPSKDAKAAYDRVILKDASMREAKKRYETLLKADTEGSQLVGLQRFGNTKANTALETTFKALVTNLADGKSDLAGVGLLYASGPNAGKQVNKEDYEKLIGDATLQGNGQDPDGIVRSYFKVGKDTYDNKGNLLKPALTVKVDSPTEVSQQFIKEGHWDQARLGISQKIKQFTANYGTANIPVSEDPRDVVTVRAVPKGESADNSHAPGTRYLISLPGKITTEVNADTPDDATEKIVQYIGAVNAKRKPVVIPKK